LPPRKAELLQMPFDELFRFLKTPPAELAGDRLFAAIAAVNLTEKRFGEALAQGAATEYRLNEGIVRL
jgi:hypothetical protein